MLMTLVQRKTHEMFHLEKDFRAWKTLQKFGYRLLGQMRELFSILRLLLTKTQIISDITFQSLDITCCGKWERLFANLRLVLTKTQYSSDTMSKHRI